MNFEFIDTLINSTDDTRNGITLTINLAHTELTTSLEKIITDLRSCEPDQYYYPSSDLHITAFDLISSHPNFHPT